MLQFDLQLYEVLTVARVKTVKFINRAVFWPAGQLCLSNIVHRQIFRQTNVTKNITSFCYVGNYVRETNMHVLQYI